MAKLDLNELSQVLCDCDMSEAIKALKALERRRETLPARMIAFIEHETLIEIEVKDRFGRIYVTAKPTRKFAALLRDIDKP